MKALLAVGHGEFGAWAKPAETACPVSPWQKELSAVEAQALESVVKIRLRVDGGVVSGTGVYVEIEPGRFGILTAHHLLVDDGETLSDDVLRGISITPLAECDCGATPIAMETLVSAIFFVPEADAAVLLLARPIAGLRPARLAATSPRAGSPVFLIGGSTLGERPKQPRIRGEAHTASEDGLLLSVSLTPESKPGDSGGGLFNGRGELVAVLSGGVSPMAVAEYWNCDPSACSAGPASGDSTFNTLGVNLPGTIRAAGWKMVTNGAPDVVNCVGS
jgi:hypothetical protein